jgi:hypothetical protein
MHKVKVKLDKLRSNTATITEIINSCCTFLCIKVTYIRTNKCQKFQKTHFLTHVCTI